MPENHFHLSTVVPFKKWLKTAFFLFVLLLTTHLRAQNPCGTTHSSHQEFSVNNARVQSGEPIYIKLYFHLVADGVGNFGFSPSDINTLIANLNQDFNPHNIHICNGGYQQINSQRHHIIDSQAKFDELIASYSVSDAINVFTVLSSHNSNFKEIRGKAESILSKNLYVQNQYALSRITAHELGHCLNLYHTHSGNGCGDGLNCVENNTNCNNCGDLICDTPPDPCLLGKLSACTYTGGSGYNPDVTNIMSYAFNCMNRFSTEQGERMRAALISSPLLQQVTTSGPPQIDIQLIPTGNQVEVNLIGKNVNIHSQNITSVTWEIVSNSGGCLGILNGNGLNALAHGGCSNWSIEVKITATNSCGSTTIYRTITPPPPFVSYILYQIAPNQYQVQGKLIASNTLAQGLSVPQSTIVPDELEIFVYEFSTGKLVLKTTEPHIDLSRQKQGIYIVNIVIGGEITTHKIQKQ